VTPAESEWSEARSAGGTNETQFSEIECTEICRSNYPASGGGYRRYPRHPANVVGRDVGFESQDGSRPPFVIPRLDRGIQFSFVIAMSPHLRTKKQSIFLNRQL
jgi:hypothetical protein